MPTEESLRRRELRSLNKSPINTTRPIKAKVSHLKIEVRLKLSIKLFTTSPTFFNTFFKIIKLLIFFI